MICDGSDYASRFSILVKFRPIDKTQRFTLLNISDDEGVEFSVVIDIAASTVSVSFRDCMRFVLPLRTPITPESNKWHRIALEWGLEHVNLYQDCEPVFPMILNATTNCRVVCDETMQIGVLEAESEVKW